MKSSNPCLASYVIKSVSLAHLTASDDLDIIDAHEWSFTQICRHNSDLQFENEMSDFIYVAIPFMTVLLTDSGGGE